ncbi:hypothetical protein HS041_27330 [Planomonospora sp. ID67723]|uniref:hypothetical protein n=1 Tax=Planomonospora sp. ID67723 TaxID=2738134 RepID=UPI0018C42699|nr:hypothetical protein [Planomonospora sp. ID67723]MBG0831461.1 hypothetical protein [Planomonospora sp. ID67723]
MIVNLTPYAIRFAGAVAAIWGIAYAINGATRAPGYVTIRVTPALESADHLRLSGVDLPAGVGLHDGELSLNVWDSTVAEQVLSRADVLLSGLCAGIAALLLSALLGSVTDGRPFQRRDPARITWLAALVIVWGLGSLLPGLAAATVLDRAGLAETFLPSLTLSWVPIAGGGFLLALALSLRERVKASDAAAKRPATDPPSCS